MNSMIIFLFSSGLFSNIDSLWASFNRTTPNVGFSAIKIDLDVVSSSMGGISYPGLANSSLQNPALFTDNVKCSFSHRAHILGTNLNQGVIHFNKDNKFLTFTLWNFLSESMELHTDIPGPSEMTYNAYDFIVATTMGRKIKNYSLGITGKLINEKIMNASYNVYAFDAGIIYKTYNGIMYSFAILNLGPDYMGWDRMKLPRIMKAGVYYGVKDIKMGLEFEKSIDTRLKMKVGLDYTRGILSFRTGGVLRADSEYFTAGIGIHIKKLLFSYAIEPFSNNLGITQLFEITLK